MPQPGPWRWLRWVVAAAVLVAVLAVGGPYVYIHFISGPAPAPLSLSPSPAAPAGSGASPGGASPDAPAGSTTVAGSWRVASGSQAGYRVMEVLAGQNNTAVGRSSAVAGHLTIAGTVVTAAMFTVQIASIHSDQSQRDAQFDGRIMDAAHFPVGSFTLTKQIQLAPVPALGVVRDYQATGNLSLHGHTRPVTFTVSAERTGSELSVAGSIPVTFTDYGIGDPSFAGFVSVQSHGTLEFLLKLSRSSPPSAP